MPDLPISVAMDAFLAEEDPATVFLPLAGGVMDDNATIGWDNASAIREAGAQGLELECSVGYRWQWVSGRMILRQVNSGQIARILAIDGVTPTSTDDDSNGFVVGTRWEITDGSVYVCTDATTNAALWVFYTELKDSGGATTLNWEDGLLQDATNSSVDWLTRYLYDGNGVISSDWNTRLLKRSGGTTELDWENCLIGGGAFQGRIDWSQAQLQNWNGSTFGQTLDWANGYLYDYYSTIIVDWFNGYMYDGGNVSLDWVYRSLTGNDATFAIDWGSRTLHGTGGSSCVDWSSGTPVFSFGATLTPTAVASLVGNEGTIAYVNDADTPVVGSAVVGSGATPAKCLVCYNGTDWIVTALL